MDLEKFSLEFEDDFNTGRFNESKWLPFYLPQWSSRRSTKPNYCFRDGHLVLQITEDQKPWSKEFNGEVKVSNLQTGVFAGPLGSPFGQHRFAKNLIVREEQPFETTYAPKYGFFEIRCSVPDIGTDNVFALWMIGLEDEPHRSAEICIVEIISSKQPKQGATIGYGLHPFGDINIRDEFYEDFFDFDVKDFHTYAVHWTPDYVDFYIDRQKVRRINQSPDYPMQFMLNIYEVPLVGHNSNHNNYPREFIIDYVRGYQLNAQ
ncbi:glycoside hydrolase family 16 protein [Roseivirga misakiensis]|uniref:Glycoside hydrolase n=1 Tax=Roseivirga misakiensis TaxID=1563681 RepID=A0A1E5SYJ9_9BACT|nr:glycoside hydrolase family 16 protein [Roseivirga misakiensis]OEK04208.1 glycoside hydrolase [Roseivirga misakiensis]